jgi:hypothetical protein
MKPPSGKKVLSKPSQTKLIQPVLKDKIGQKLKKDVVKPTESIS